MDAWVCEMAAHDDPSERIILHFDREACSLYVKDLYGPDFGAKLYVHRTMAILEVGSSMTRYIHRGSLQGDLFRGRLKYCSLTCADHDTVHITLSCFDAPLRCAGPRNELVTASFELCYVWMGKWKVDSLEHEDISRWRPEYPAVPNWDVECDALDMAEGQTMRMFKNGSLSTRWSIQTRAADTNAFSATRSESGDGGDSILIECNVWFADYNHLTLVVSTATSEPYKHNGRTEQLYRGTVRYRLRRVSELLTTPRAAV
jgi:hypothetical protein